MICIKYAVNAGHQPCTSEYFNTRHYVIHLQPWDKLLNIKPVMSRVSEPGYFVGAWVVTLASLPPYRTWGGGDRSGSRHVHNDSLFLMTFSGVAGSSSSSARHFLLLLPPTTGNWGHRLSPFSPSPPPWPPSIPPPPPPPVLRDPSRRGTSRSACWTRRERLLRCP